MARTFHHSTPVQTPRKKLRVRKPRKKSNPIPAILGFLVFLGGTGYAVFVVGKAQSATREFHVDYAQERTEIERAAEVKEAEIKTRRKELAAQLKKMQTANLDLKRLVQITESDLGKKAKELEKKELVKNSLSQRVSSQVEDKELVGESVEELRQRLRALKKRRAILMNAFEQSYEELKTELNRLVLNNDADRLNSFFIKNSTTALAPAAGFFTADAFYARNQPRKASDIYKRVLQKFPDSEYAKECGKRLANIKGRQAYNPEQTVGFFPYKIPDSLDTGSWR